MKNVNIDVAHKFLKEGKWPDGIQIPKNSSVLNPDGSINWSKAAEGGYTLNVDGTAIKEQFTPEMREVIDRYGNANGRYTSPVINGESYSYTERSLPYVEDLSNYHQYEVKGDFTKIKEYVDKCTDIKLKTEIETTVRKYYKGDYSRLVSYKGDAAAVEGWGKGGAVQYEFSLTVEQLEGLGLLKEIK
ncbi:glycohydrolase toxin TNT-related protein [Bacillus cereus]|uniref:glycohydrolase toxin TNT-related protein n=1 Tax=Bacillus cereus TaxID=1396 RepID=UPI000C28CF9C|nr:glycohydrolase toxin TNT-related protein [Bacillus cereus]